jgi:hypothetical protein
LVHENACHRNDGGGSLDWRMRNGLSVFAAAEYTAMSDSSNTVTGRAGLRYGF